MAYQAEFFAAYDLRQLVALSECCFLERRREFVKRLPAEIQ